MKKFINRKSELTFLNEQYKMESSSMVILYGRRRIGKTSLINEFIKDKSNLFFLASEESEEENMKEFRRELHHFSGDSLMSNIEIDNWDILFNAMSRYISSEKMILVIDEFQYLGKTNKAFPSIFQRIWEKNLKQQNIMVILCGSLVRMMEEQTLNYNSPLYGRRTGQIKLQQIQFDHYNDFIPQTTFKEQVEFYAVTGGVPKYIELFDGTDNIYNQINRLILDKQSLLFEEPRFLLQNEVKEIGSYFSVIKSIAAGNQKLSKICTDLQVKQTNMSTYLRTLIDLDILMRDVPITEKDPSSSKMGLYRIKDNFIKFWFQFVYPEKSRLERGDTTYVEQKIRQNFIDNHVSYVYEDICQQKMWSLVKGKNLPINKIGRWWNGNNEIDIVGINTLGNEIIFGECKYRSNPIDAAVFFELLKKKEQVLWNKADRKEFFVLCSISGYTQDLVELARNRGDLILMTHQ